MRLTEAKSGELRAEIGAVKTELSAVKESMRSEHSSLRTGIDSANAGLRSELEVVKAVVHTTQVTISALSNRLECTEMSNRGIKRRRIDLDISHRSNREQGRDQSSPLQAQEPALPSSFGVKSVEVDFAEGVGQSEEEVEAVEEELTTEVDKRPVGGKLDSILTKKGILVQGPRGYLVSDTPGTGRRNGVEIQVDSKIELSAFKKHRPWVVFSKSSWRVTYGAYAHKQSAERNMNVVGADESRNVELLPSEWRR